MSKKFFTTESLATLVNEIKKYVANAILTKADSSHSHTITDVDSLQDTLNAKATQGSLDSHVSDTSKHITEEERTNWNAAKTHADSAHVTSVNGMTGDVVIDIPEDYVTGDELVIITNGIDEQFETLNSKIGSLTNLEVQGHDNLVDAINDVYLSSIGGAASLISDVVGSLSNLSTTNKTNVVVAINEVNGTATEAYALANQIDDALADYAKKTEIPTKVSAFENDASYLTEHQSLEGLATESYVNAQIATIPTPDVSGQINTHNTATDSHNDIRLLVEGLTTRLNTLANSDDTTLDQMSEIVAYIKNNKTLIEGVTTNKVNVSDIINNLTTNVSDKPLSAAQGVALKALIDAIVVPTKVSELTNDSGYITGYTETDPTVPEWAKAVTKPSYTASEVGALPADTVIPTVPTNVSAFTNDAGYLTEHQSLDGYATETYVNTQIQTYVEEAILGGAW